MDAGDQVSDEQLMREFTRGSDVAFEELVHRHGAGIKAYARRLLGDAELAEDVYIETFARLARHRQTLSLRGTARGLLYTIAHRLCLDLLRRQRTEQRSAPHLVRLAERRRDRTSTDDGAVMGELGACLDRAMERLRVEHRQVLLLRTVHGLSTRETAEAMGLTEMQVRSQLCFARKRLREALARQGWIRPSRRVAGGSA